MQKLLASLEWWEAGTILGLFALAWGGSWLLNRILLARFHSLREAHAPATGIAVLKAFVPLVRWGLSLAAVAVALQVAELPELVAAWLNTGLEAAFTLLSASAAGAAVTVMFRHWAKRPLDPSAHRTRTTMAPVLAKSCKIFFYIIAFLLILQNGGYNVAGLLAGLGIGGLAVALAGKETLANLFGSIAVLVDRPFQVGDLIRQADIEGTVEKIGLRSCACARRRFPVHPQPDHHHVAGGEHLDRRPGGRCSRSGWFTICRPTDAAGSAVVRGISPRIPRRTMRGFTGRTLPRVRSISRLSIGRRRPRCRSFLRRSRS